MNNIYVPCEICEVNPASEVQGGINWKTKERGLWTVCKECRQHIIDERKNERRS
jgi:hypothetical protein